MSFFRATGTPVLDFWWRLLSIDALSMEVFLKYKDRTGLAASNASQVSQVYRIYTLRKLM